LLYWIKFLEAEGIGFKEAAPETFNRYQAWLLNYTSRFNRPLGINTQLNILSAVKVFYRFLHESGHLLHNPAANLRLPKERKKLPTDILTAAEARRLLKQPDLNTVSGFRDRTMLEVLYSCGLRISELRQLKEEDFDSFTLDANGEAIVEFNTNSQPGSNYRVAVTLNQFSTDLDALQVSDSSQESYVTADDEQVSGFPGAVSPLLTVWRKLHIEVDSMDPGPPSSGPEANFIEGTVANIVDNNVDFGIYAVDYDQDAFKGGRLAIDGRPEYDDSGLFAYYEVSAFESGHVPFHPSDSGETTNVDIIRTPELSDIGKSFKIYDDDDAYLGIAGIPESLPKDDESDTFINAIKPKYAPAFIEVVNANTMGLNPNTRIDFKLNEQVIGVGNVSHFDNAKDLNDSTYFWTHALVFGYQPQTSVDYDPSDENPLYGGTPETGLLNNQSVGYSVVYTELFREFVFNPKPLSASVSNPSTITLYQNLYWNWALGVAAHEIAHSPGTQGEGGDHSEGGLMGEGGANIQLDFTAKSLKRFRSTSSWSQ